MAGEKKGHVDYNFPLQNLPISILHQIHLDKKYPFLTGLGELLADLCLNLTNLKIDAQIGNPIPQFVSSENVKSLARVGPGGFCLAPCSPGNLVHTHKRVL